MRLFSVKNCVKNISKQKLSGQPAQPVWAEREENLIAWNISYEVAASSEMFVPDKDNVCFRIYEYYEILLAKESFI